jgi:hypothetical protein
MTDGHDAPPVVYRIRVQGRLDAQWSDWLGGLTMTYGDADGNDTILCGPVIDQAAPHGLLIKIRDLGVPLLAVQCLDPEPGQGRVPAQWPRAPLQQTQRKARDMQRSGIQRKGRTRR